ncbi:MAG: S49 family peptidase [Anaerolineales bacterium]|nr:S49 family peptidase [Anaerolineales bacterium]
MAQKDSNWERELLTNLATDYMRDQRRQRRWKIAYRLLILVFILISLFTFSPRRSMDDALRSKPHTALIDIEGPIFSKSPANADDIAASLKEAYKDKGTTGILLRINSPGGSPVQANFIYNELRRQKKAHPSIPIYAVCTDMCASAAYYIAAGSDKIFADPSSLVGSIGVIYNGFGFVDTLHKLGIERRMLTAGVNKGFLDPFSPMDDQQKMKLLSMLDSVHQEFINKVKAGRGKRLHDNPDLFSGLFWTGQQAKSMGLVDDLMSPGQVARDIIGAEKTIDYTSGGSFFEKMAKRFGAEVGVSLGTLLGLGSPLT